MKKAYSLVFDGDMVKAMVPRELMQVVLKVQGEDDLDFPSACKRVAELANAGSDKFNKRVKDEARKLHNSELMTQMNAARGTIRTSGFNEGYAAGMKDYRLWYYCSVCGEGIWLEPNTDSHKAIIQYMKEHGWHHGKCQPR
jgi:hypothetical protein